jgi:hypothetical protein
LKDLNPGVFSSQANFKLPESRGYKPGVQANEHFLFILGEPSRAVKRYFRICCGSGILAAIDRGWKPLPQIKFPLQIGAAPAF